MSLVQVWAPTKLYKKPICYGVSGPTRKGFWVGLGPHTLTSVKFFFDKWAHFCNLRVPLIHCPYHSHKSIEKLRD